MAVQPRFAFGKNWTGFLSRLDESKVNEAERSLKEMLGVDPLNGGSFLDIGSGSGLFSLAAMRLGAKRVYSFDYDPNSVHCTRELKGRYYPTAEYWDIQPGDVLNPKYLRSLGKFEIVYSWGVLHHTGNMRQALENVLIPLADNGKLYISIYNDQGWPSRAWTWVKRAYNQLPPPFRFLILWPAFLRLWGPRLILDTLKGNPLKTWRGCLPGMMRWIGWAVIPLRWPGPRGFLSSITPRG
jgi:SAM-dependent methyltransferase